MHIVLNIITYLGIALEKNEPIEISYFLFAIMSSRLISSSYMDHEYYKTQKLSIRVRDTFARKNYNFYEISAIGIVTNKQIFISH